MKNKLRQEEFDKNLKAIAKTSIIVFIGIIFSKIITYVYRIIIARYFGPEDYGLFSLALMVIGWAIAFSSLGLQNGLVRFIPIYRAKKENQKIRYIFRVSVKLSLLISLLFGALLFFLSEPISLYVFHNPDLTIFLKLFSLAIPLTVLLQISLSILSAFEKVSLNSFIFNFFQNFIKLIFLIILIFVGFNSNSIPISFLAGLLLATIFSFSLSKFYFPDIFKKYSLKKGAKQAIKSDLLSYSWPLLFFSILLSLFYWTDSLVIGLIKTTSDVGFYNAAIPIAVLIGLVPELFLGLFFPLITKEYTKSKKNIENIKQLSQQVGKWIFVINLPLFILIVLFPGAFLNILFGPEYLVASSALRILSIGILFSSVFTVSQSLLSMIGKSKLIFYDTLVIVAVNIILNFILISRFGINGAAISTSISLIILNCLFLFQARKNLSIIPLRRKMVSILFSGLLATAVLLYLRSIISLTTPVLVLISLLFLLLYLFFVLLFKSFDKNDLLIINSMRNKLRLNTRQ